jgi:3-hydroxyisobutyrate dehydrogenase-like beta-hydroxyacid dehydrogenase
MYSSCTRRAAAFRAPLPLQERHAAGASLPAALPVRPAFTYRVGFVGLGAMGEGMAACLLRDGFQVAILGNVNRGPVDRLVAAGAVEALEPLELARRVDVICLCLPNSDVVEDVIERMKPALAPGKTILDTGTSSLASTARLGQTLGQLGVGFAEAPLTGGKAQADEGVLGALVGTTEDTFSTVKPLLDSFCSSVQLFGPVGSGGRAKLINNAMVIGIAALVLEAFRKARRTQTNWAQLYDVVTRGSADSGVLRRIVGTALGHTPPIDGSDNKYRGCASPTG